MEPYIELTEIQILEYRIYCLEQDKEFLQNQVEYLTEELDRLRNEN